ncbi:MAG: PAS domain S-box protein, partial [Methanothrix sp.]|nr:PAS domain S-box protein [Methanothrix sp.]
MPPDPLEYNSELFRLLIDNLLQGLLILQDEHVIFANKAASEISGYTQEELQSYSMKDLRSIVHTGDQERTFKSIENLIIGNLSTARQKFRIIRKDGSIRWIDALASCIKYQDMPALQLAYLDITERKLAEEALHDSEERFRLFMDNSPAIAWVKDEQGRHVYLSKTYESRFGVQIDDWRGKTDFEVWPPEVAEQFRKNDQDVLASWTPIDIIEETLNPDGCCRYWWNFKFPMRDSAGKKYVAGIGVDITERKQMEEELRRYKDELEQKVLERTEDLSRANLAFQAEIAERKKAEEMLCLQRDLGVALSSSGDLKEALNLILDACLRVKGIDCGGIYLVDENLGDIRLVARTNTGLPRQFAENGDHYGPDSLQARLIMAGKPIYASYSWLSSVSSDVYPMKDLRAVAIIPVKCGEKVASVLNLASRTVDEIPPGVRTTLEAIAAQVGEAIEKIKAKEELLQSEDYMDKIVNTIGDPIFVK